MEETLRRITVLKQALEAEKLRSSLTQIHEQLELLLVSTKDLHANVIRALNLQALNRTEVTFAEVNGQQNVELVRIPGISSTSNPIETFTHADAPASAPSYEVFEVVFTKKPFGFRLGPAT